MAPSFSHFVLLADRYGGWPISMYDISASNDTRSYSNIRIDSLGAEDKFDILQLTLQGVQQPGA